MRLAFLGGGVMAEAILRSLLTSGLLSPADISVSEPAPARRELLASLGVAVTASNLEALADAEAVVLAVKPYVLPSVLAEVAPALKPEQLLISIAAGVTVAQLEAAAGEGQPVIRVMPNTPVQVGAGASALCRGTHATPEHAAQVLRLFQAGGSCVEVTEPQLDAVIGLSGSGPAYVFIIIEALADGGVKMGLPRNIALTLAAQTVLGAGKLVLESGEHPGLLKDRVATPGGTTIAGLAAMEEAGVRSGMIKAVEASARRAMEMAKPKPD